MAITPFWSAKPLYEENDMFGKFCALAAWYDMSRENDKWLILPSGWSHDRAADEFLGVGSKFELMNEKAMIRVCIWNTGFLSLDSREINIEGDETLSLSMVKSLVRKLYDAGLVGFHSDVVVEWIPTVEQDRRIKHFHVIDL